ncbi:MAG: hypothetical protein R2909_11985 [Gemmatimonadales bacterium]
MTLALAAILLRLQEPPGRERWDRIEASFAPAVLDVMAGAPIDPALREIASGDVPYFIRFLARIAREVRGRSSSGWPSWPVPS